MALVITKQQLKKLRTHAEEDYPKECCGVLLGTISDNGRVVLEVIRCGNVSQSPGKRYAIDPAELVRIQRDGRERGLKIVGFYHSHPDSDAMWSDTDLNDAEWPRCSYLITAVARGHATTTRSYELVFGTDNEKQFVEDPLLDAD